MMFLILQHCVLLAADIWCVFPSLCFVCLTPFYAYFYISNSSTWIV